MYSPCHKCLVCVQGKGGSDLEKQKSHLINSLSEGTVFRFHPSASKMVYPWLMLVTHVQCVLPYNNAEKGKTSDHICTPEGSQPLTVTMAVPGSDISHMTDCAAKRVIMSNSDRHKYNDIDLIYI